jgi:hypothetical protein
MRSLRNKQFKTMFAKLPKTAQAEARKAYKLWRENPAHPSLQFKPLGEDIWSSENQFAVSCAWSRRRQILDCLDIDWLIQRLQQRDLIEI